MNNDGSDLNTGGIHEDDEKILNPLDFLLGGNKDKQAQLVSALSAASALGMQQPPAPAELPPSLPVPGRGLGSGAEWNTGGINELGRSPLPPEQPDAIADMLADKDKSKELFAALGRMVPQQQPPTGAFPTQLEGDALAAAIKQNPGPVATTGFNPAAANPALPASSPAEGAASRSLASLTTKGPAAAVAAPQSAAAPKAPADFYGAELNDQAIKDAQQKGHLMQLLAGLGAAGSQAGAAMSRGTVKADLTASQALEKQAGEGVNEILQRRKGKVDELEGQVKLSDLQRKQSLRDAASPQSKAARELAASMGIKISPDMTAEQVDALSDMLNKKMQYEQIKLSRMDANDRKAKEKEDDRFGKASKLINADMASGRSGFGGSSKTLLAAEKLQKLVAGRDANKLNTREIAEMARQMDAILSNGNPTISGMKKLIPDSYSGDLAHITEYLTNKNKGAGMGSFVNQMLETVDREKSLSREQIGRTQRRLLSGYTDLQKKNPERWNGMMMAYDLPSDISFDGKDDGVNIGADAAESHAAAAPQAKAAKQVISVSEDEIKKMMAAAPTLSRDQAAALLQRRKAAQGVQ